MKAARLQSKVLAAGLAAVLTVPYTAPSVCWALGTMGNTMEMTANAGTDTVGAPESGMTCCTLNDCGVPEVALLGYALNVLQQVATLGAELPAPPSAHPANALLTPIPPPKA